MLRPLQDHYAPTICFHPQIFFLKLHMLTSSPLIRTIPYQPLILIQNNQIMLSFFSVSKYGILNVYIPPFVFFILYNQTFYISQFIYIYICCGPHSLTEFHDCPLGILHVYVPYICLVTCRVSPCYNMAHQSALYRSNVARCCCRKVV